VADKPVKVKQPEKGKSDGRAIETAKSKPSEKPKAIQTKAPEKDKDKEKAQPRQPNRVVRYWRETIGELRKVSWPTPQEAWRLTYIVIIVMLSTAAVLGFLDFLFSRLVGLLVSI
jgi:preprotein translocase subunit SecE